MHLRTAYEIFESLGLTGPALTVAGPLLMSRLLAGPHCDVILSRDPADPPTNWRSTRARCFQPNWWRGARTWTAFAFFLAASCTYRS